MSTKEYRVVWEIDEESQFAPNGKEAREEILDVAQSAFDRIRATDRNDTYGCTVFSVLDKAKNQWYEVDLAQQSVESQMAPRSLAAIRDMLDELRAASRFVVDRWEKGDLAEAVRELEVVLKEIDNELGDADAEIESPAPN